MAFRLNSEQTILRDTMRSFLRPRSIVARLQSRVELDPGVLLKSMTTDLGLMGLAGGDGSACGNVEIALIQRELGTALVRVPFWDSVAISPRFLNPNQLLAVRSGDCVIAAALPALSGTVRAIATGGGWFLSGSLAQVRHAAQASHILALADAGAEHLLLLIPAAATVMTALDGVDDVPVANIDLNDVPVTSFDLLARGVEACLFAEQATSLALVGMCCEGLGLLDAMLQLSRDYAATRQQFGKPIATFQSISHRLAEMRMSQVRAEAATENAIAAMGSTSVDFAMHASAAKVELSEALRDVREHSVQIHGAMGLTEEMAISHFFRAALAVEQLYGDADYHVRRYAALMG